MCRSSQKNLGQKVDVKFFTVYPYSVGTKVPQTFLELGKIQKNIFLKIKTSTIKSEKNIYIKQYIAPASFLFFLYFFKRWTIVYRNLCIRCIRVGCKKKCSKKSSILPKNVLPWLFASHRTFTEPGNTFAWMSSNIAAGLQRRSMSSSSGCHFVLLALLLRFASPSSKASQLSRNSNMTMLGNWIIMTVCVARFYVYSCQHIVLETLPYVCIKDKDMILGYRKGKGRTSFTKTMLLKQRM